MPLLNFKVMSIKVCSSDDGGNLFESDDGVELIVEVNTSGWIHSVIDQKETWLDLLDNCKYLLARGDNTGKIGCFLVDGKLKESTDTCVILNHEDGVSKRFPCESN